MTRVVHHKKEPYDVLIDRTTIWGNPYSHQEGTLAKYKVTSRKKAIAKYRQYILNNKELMSRLDELKDKVLGCWCSPKSCHGDILVDLCDNIPRVNLEDL